MYKFCTPQESGAPDFLRSARERGGSGWVLAAPAIEEGTSARAEDTYSLFCLSFVSGSKTSYIYSTYIYWVPGIVPVTQQPPPHQKKNPQKFSFSGDLNSGAEDR